jgi:hypothetical protein
MKKISKRNILFASALFSAPAYAQEKSLIEWGYDSPDTSFFAGNITAMQQTPFAGTVFTARPNTGTNNEFSWDSWGTTVYTQAQMQQAVTNLQSVNWGNFNQNFLRFNTTPGNVDWFDSFNSILSNVGTAAWIVQQAGPGVQGLWFDDEAYQGQLWEYSAQKYTSTYSFAQYEAQVELRGEQVMNAIQAVDPNITIVIPNAFEDVWEDIDGNLNNLQSNAYGLLPAFLNGMIEAAGSGIKLVDGDESTYGDKTLSQFEANRTTILSTDLPLVQDPTKYLQLMGVSSGTFMDLGHATGQWYTNPSQFNLNYFTPSGFQTALTDSLQVADQYAYVYSETSFWWPSNGVDNVPTAYSQAAQAAAIAGNPNSWAITGSGDWTNGANWADAVEPNGVGAQAMFLRTITSPETVYTNSPITVGSMTFDNVFTYVIGGAGSLTLQVSAGDANVTVNHGSHEIDLPMTIASNTVFDVAGGATLVIDNPLTIDSGVTLVQSGAGTVTYNSIVNLLGGAAISFGASVHADSLSLSSGSTASLTGSGTTLQVNSLSNAGTIDVQKNALMIDYSGGGDPIASVRAELLSGYNNGLWNGHGIISSSITPGSGGYQYGIGYADSADGVVGGLSSGEVEVKYTLLGDANLDGVVDAADLAILASNFGHHVNGWDQGDFTYSGTVNAADFAGLAANFILDDSNPGDLAALDAFAAANGLMADVPEPASVGLVWLGAIAALGARRRRKSVQPMAHASFRD